MPTKLLYPEEGVHIHMCYVIIIMEDFSVAPAFLITVLCWVVGNVKTVLDCPNIILSA